MAGCSTVVDGRAVKASVRPGSSGVDVALLDPGNYPRRPSPPLGKVANEQAGALIEAERIANNVVGPWEVDPSLQVTVPVNTKVLPNVESVRTFWGDDLTPAVAAHNYVTGFTTERMSLPPAPGKPAGTGEKGKTLCNMVLRFATPADAVAAASEMAAKDAAMPHPDTTAPPVRLAIPHHPDTIANNLNTTKGFEADVFTARGPYVLFQDAGAMESVAALTQMITTVLDLQGPLIDRFQATPADQLATVAADPTGLLARTVAANDTTHGAVFEPHAALQFRHNPIDTQKMFTAAGVQHLVINRSAVYEAVDPTGADRAVEFLVRSDVPEYGYQSSAGITGLPGARCFDRGQKPDQDSRIRYLCVAAADRYAIRVTAAQERDAHQVVAAQYLMLTAK
ncbi:hypothetical protein AWC14_03370 [Mycobacterium kyorinense]|uniref:Uncharacterized protein n=1 Tax=Mycobacterium kyorinense TaxID=487514 RepID=A0A1X1Y072_9MYCO|nr:hypothetical protein AWC14_03370 [Mycobacterium kyorinense]